MYPFIYFQHFSSIKIYPSLPHPFLFFFLDELATLILEKINCQSIICIIYCLFIFQPLYIPPYVNTCGFTSRLRSPRLWDPSNPDHKKLSPPPYTPPPMLSPVRSGSGLFWHIISGSGSLTPKSAPITPSFGLGRKGKFIYYYYYLDNPYCIFLVKREILFNNKILIFHHIFNFCKTTKFHLGLFIVVYLLLFLLF